MFNFLSVIFVVSLLAKANPALIFCRRPTPLSSFSLLPAVSFTSRTIRLQNISIVSLNPIKKPSLIDLNMTSKLLLLLLLALLSSPLSFVSAFTMSSIPTARHPHCDLPGDPSLILQTNVDLGDKKSDVMKELSALVAKSLGKPESYVGE